MQTIVKLYSLDFRQSKTYLLGALFIVGNLIFPQLCHLIPQVGLIFLPIYFFTLIAAYKYGWKVGLMTAFMSPILNSLLFGMPMIASLPSILFKSVLLATFAGMAATYFKKATLSTLTCVVITYQIVGTFFEWCIVGSLYIAIQDFRIGIPGIILQILGGYVFINYIFRK